MAEAVSGVADTDGEDKILSEARKQFDRCKEAWEDNQARAKEDLEFARLGKQWDTKIEELRTKEARPCLTFNKMPAFIRQVVNDARQNKPAIKVHPQDSGADPQVAEIINGLIRNIETTSDADVAYDTAIEHAVGQGFGFWRINTAYTSDDAFDQDIVIERISNPFTVFGDPRSTAADSSDWDVAFIVSTMTKDEFEREYPDAEKTDWEADFREAQAWVEDDSVTIAEYWSRERVRREIVALSDGSVIDTKKLEESPEDFAGLEVVGQPREVEGHKVTQRIMTGAEVLKTVEWAGKYIPIVPVYGDEVIDEDGKRHFRSLIRDAKSAQQMFNYWRTTTTEMIALAPKAPFIGKKGTFASDSNWDTANSESHAYLEYDGETPPQRQPFQGIPAGALQEALNAADDMKSIIGIYDASLGARSNETSGRAIMARQREGDVSTFHFIDNLSRAIRHGGRILLDLIPKVYTTARVLRILGEDLMPQTVQVEPTGQPVQEVPGEGGPVNIYDITAGKYDLTVSAGPSFTSRREEAAQGMERMMQSNPEVAVVVGDIWAEMQDWPQADKIAERLQSLLPEPIKAQMGQGTQQPQIPPEVQQMVQQGAQMIEQLQQQLAEAQAQAQDKQGDRALKFKELQLEEQKLAIDAERARTERMKVSLEAQQPSEPPQWPQGTA